MKKREETKTLDQVNFNNRKSIISKRKNREIEWEREITLFFTATMIAAAAAALLSLRRRSEKKKKKPGIQMAAEEP